MFFRDISNLEEELKTTAGTRERVFYNYLCESAEIDLAVDVSEIDNLIYDILTNNKTGLEDQIELIVRMKNRKGVDYRKSLVILVAFGLYDSDRFIEDVKSYITTCNLRDSYLLSEVFEYIKPDYNKVVSTPIDKLVSEVLINKNYAKGSDLLISALNSVSDILDLYIVKEAYKTLGEQNFQGTNTFNIMKSSINVLNEWIGNLYIIRFLIVFWMFSLPIIFFFGKFISDNWNVAEPLTYIGGVILGIVINSFLLLNKSINIQLFREKIKSKNLIKVYQKNKLHYEEIEDIINDD